MPLALLNNDLIRAELKIYHHIYLLSHLSIISLSSLDSHLQLRLNEIYLGSKGCTIQLGIIEGSQIQLLLVGLQVGELVVPLIIS